MDANRAGVKTPWFVPIYTRGLDKSMPLGKIYVPRPGHDFLVAYGEPVDFGPIVEEVKRRYPDEEAVARARITSVVSDLVQNLHMDAIAQWRDRLGRDPEGYEGGVGGEMWWSEKDGKAPPKSEWDE